MDRKGANTFPFYNLLPEPKKTSQRSFLCFLTFPQDKIKSRWRLLLNRNICEHKRKTSSQFSHRITELATLLGNILKVGLPQGLDHLCFQLIALFALHLWALHRSFIDPNPDLGNTLLGSIICEGPVRRIPTWVKQWLRWCGTLVCTDIPCVATRRIWVF